MQGNLKKYSKKMGLNHKQKIKLARKMMSQKEIRRGISMWQSKAWTMRWAHNFTKQKLQHAKA